MQVPVQGTPHLLQIRGDETTPLEDFQGSPRKEKSVEELFTATLEGDYAEAPALGQE
jgi:hypothetical protein